MKMLSGTDGSSQQDHEHYKTDMAKAKEIHKTNIRAPKEIAHHWLVFKNNGLEILII